MRDMLPCAVRFLGQTLAVVLRIVLLYKNRLFLVVGGCVSCAFACGDAQVLVVIISDVEGLCIHA